ncbi:MotE family protein [Virgibacillus sp. DJP39]|uniref:MotE family protein n=1 Tax=Virgibacillus sp. DJP39 TaxID=3409790 RepID=UPI003BB59A5D
MTKNSDNKIKTKSNPILWFLFAIIVPLVVAVTIIGIIFSVAGFNVIDWVKTTGNSIPVVSSVIDTEEEKTQQRTKDDYKDKINKKDEKINELKKEVGTLEGTVERLEQEIIKLESADSPKLIDETAEESSNENEKNSQLKSLIASFEKIDPEKTALILKDLEEGIVIAILKGLPEDIRAAIFEEMEPEQAAQYTKAYLNSRS